MNTENDSSPYGVLFLLGAGHSGSTLLNLLMNAHTKAIGLCEIHTIQNYLHLPLHDGRNPLRHPFWRRVAECWSRRTATSFVQIDLRSPQRHHVRSWGPDRRRKYRDHNRILFDCVAEVSGAAVIVDSSHNRWRLLELEHSRIGDLKVVHVVRDGRALVNSYSKKYKSLPVGFRRWFVPTIMALLVRARVRAPWMTVRYEDLARNPEECLRRICDFAGLQYEAGMLRYWEHDDVSVGGNRMRLQKSPIRLDEKWRTELSGRGKTLFALAGGWLNVIYGYSPLSMGATGTSMPESRSPVE